MTGKDLRQRAKPANFGASPGMLGWGAGRRGWLAPLRRRLTPRAPTRRLWGLTWVGWLNFLVLRWFFVRLAYEAPIGRCLNSAPKGGLVTVEIDFGMPTRWYLNRWIWPRPWSAYRYVGRPRGGVVPAKLARYEGLKAAREIARHMTPAQREEQALGFAYGNLAASTNHKPTREAFAELAAKRGWSPERFAAWADARCWWVRGSGG